MRALCFGGKVGEEGAYTVSLPSTNTASIENEPHRSCVLMTMAREHIKTREHEVILVVSTIACYKC